MDPPFFSREQVARHLAVSTATLVRLETLGLVRPARRGEAEVYGPAEVRRAWTVVSLHRDAGINLAGVEAILRLRAQLDEVHRQLSRLADGARQALEAELEADDEP